MARRIHILPDAVANQIAAGEVVERPASVVKELVENALDARATRVEIAVERGGKRRIRVSDDGVGMGREDSLLCLDRHATSKISHAEDLKGIRTFGFRGEAVPSIAAVSRLTMETHDADDEVGTRIVMDGGRIAAVDDFPRQRGTTMEIRNLFFNAPARAKFLKSVSAETRAISEVVTSLALANPRVGFSLTSDDRVLLDLAPAADAGGRVAQIWGGKDAGSLVSVTGEAGGMEIEGLVQRPDAAQPGLRRAHLFVNGRPFRSANLIRAAERGYRTTIPHGARPWIFLYVRVPGGEVDVNVHPAKAEVRFRDDSRVEELVETAIRAALDHEASAATFDSSPRGPSHPMAVREPPPREAPEAQMALFTSSMEGSPSGDAGVAPLPVVEAPRPRLWQVLNTYILAETRDGILIVDQHSAHERVLFQRLMDAYEAGGQTGQRLLFPLTMRLTQAEYRQVEELGGLLGRAGFEVEGFGGDTVIVHAVPNPHPYFDAERAFREMIDELTHGSELVRSAKNQHERIAMTFACKGAIKAGQRLSPREMQELFDELFATELPHHDVHGRPTIVRLSAAELERKFGR
ncbi:MAG: DNA mismatch repair endonuclease MutL [Gemmatimonadota bacterium]|nr:DNA mismatch repair endonuclease MutL [Gemmatimonadota bacterium]MDH5760849.1 DNA mismatch repair endonuclease MutL [Gemmatimonadota bacterium]